PRRLGLVSSASSCLAACLPACLGFSAPRSLDLGGGPRFAALATRPHAQASKARLAASATRPHARPAARCLLPRPLGLGARKHATLLPRPLGLIAQLTRFACFGHSASCAQATPPLPRHFRPASCNRPTRTLLPRPLGLMRANTRASLLATRPHRAQARRLLGHSAGSHARPRSSLPRLLGLVARSSCCLLPRPLDHVRSVAASATRPHRACKTQTGRLGHSAPHARPTRAMPIGPMLIYLPRLRLASLCVPRRQCETTSSRRPPRHCCVHFGSMALATTPAVRRLRRGSGRRNARPH
ncbi:unnamed protein product, partial [Musa acuminata subsp. burmannicoides]